MRRIALGLLVAAAFGAPALAAEPDGPATLITPTEAVRITVQGLLSGKSAMPRQARAGDALIEYYSVPDQRLLWVDDNGLTERAKMVMAEIGKADDYGLRASDYALPDAASFNASGPQVTGMARRRRGEGQLCGARTTPRMRAAAASTRCA